MAFSTNKGNSGNRGVSLLVLLLLLVYLGGVFEFESIHGLIHEPKAEVHSVQHELDPCHQSLYHQERNQGCEHKYHLTKQDKCPLCHYTIQPLTWQDHDAGLPIVSENCDIAPAIDEANIKSFLHLSPTRGPPYVFKAA